MKDKRFINEQKELLKNGMNGVPLDSSEYATMQERFIEWDGFQEKKKRKFNWNNLWELLKIVTGLASTAAGVGATIYMANLAYDEEKALKFKNGSVWNMATKKK